MIYTVFCPAAADLPRPWQSELLGHSWGRARQPGELVQLLQPVGLGDRRPDDVAACHSLARVLETQSWSPHPYTGDLYPPYQLAASVFEWLFVEQIEGTVLLLEPTSVFTAPVSTEVGPGQARGTAWADLPLGAGPFGLGPGFEFLADFCVDRALDLAPVTLPVVIHSTDLRKIVVRWLELMSIIRAETAASAAGPLQDADKIAYLIAAAEARVPHAVADQDTAAIWDHRQPIATENGEIVWEAGSYRSWRPVPTEGVKAGQGRDFLVVLAEVVERHVRGRELSSLRPHRQQGVREGKILGSMFLEIPGRADTVSLNPSGAAIWEVCDGTRNLDEINQELETRFEMPAGSLRPDVEVVIKRLEGIGALRLALT